ncbi:dTDP-4-dehydrorhamnose reductase [Mixta calida]|uniref:dTDP-4-dehydrorhamnose reductase n=1 Tax=Mixta calida TaxID=665913 RepID=A0ABM6S2L7_9GAMM|nr:dTDP-4-dehydrorhamnose reductase [Mixta calida]AUY25713.1 dTDP-4-dehydrorhamnose reductase [Mixta calida]KAF0861237.1 dTDP-4-dehydrorhamnose reductase [Mixta calida B021323]ORM56704.1 dTDP-4-dehydrorhamnose reductase [Mixta calida]
MRILLTGAYGQLGRCLLDRFPADWVMLACGSAELDITDRAAVERIVRRFRPQVIMNAAAYTAVDKAEIDRIRAMKINAIGPENLARAAREVGAQLIHISTDYVFDGSKPTPYIESDLPCPINFYGLSKWEGEKRVQAILPQAIIIRTSWVFSEYGNNFVKTMLRLAQTHETIRVVNDQRGCPTYAGDLAQAMIALAAEPEAAGIYHYCGDKAVSWYEFAQAIFSLRGSAPRLVPISSREYITTAPRPGNSALLASADRQPQRSSNWLSALGIVSSDDDMSYAC